MKNLGQGGLVLGLAVLLAAVFLFAQGGPSQAQGARDGRARYSIVETQGHNLLVTDNESNKLYFYTIDKDAQIGAPLKLRASLDLSQVGKPEISFSEHAVERGNKK